MLLTRRWLTLLLPLVVALSQSACTLINYGIGSAIDAGNKQVYAPANVERALEPGTKVTVVLLDSREVKGKYAGLEPEPPEEYAERYAVARAELAPRFPLPGLGEPITVTYRTGALLKAEFAGFDLGWLIVVTNARQAVPLADLRELESTAGTISGDALALLISEGALPLMSGIALDDAKLADGSREERARIPLDGVRYITRKPSTARTKGLILGALVDAAAIALIVACADGGCATSYGW
jgi:hypothetical protein